ncbi:MAG: cytochrome-c peroxidase [Leptolyngbyaceae cyanobacterium MO_188.B28]|nr:cytochrome-c peroxidase [Leptolyngbyaceae cyanobacterium MO_188.B28]
MNRSFKSFVIPIALFCLVILFSWQWAKVLERPAAAINLGPPISVAGDEPIEPIPITAELNQEKVALGNQLFHEPRLSRDNTISCASCHDLNKGGTDQRAFPIGIDSQEGFLNAPTVLNNSFHFRQFWDGRARSLQDQIEGPIHASHEMDSNWPEIISKLKQSPEYVQAFKQIYADNINSDHIKDAIAIFENSLFTPNSRFDRFLRGDTNALTNNEKEGYRRFKAYGCVSCHQGILLGGNMFQKFGVFGDYFKDRGNITEADLGRFNVTGQEEDRYAFKVPSLRNIELTAPYFHDGTAETLDEAVKVMIKYQLGREVNQQDIDLIIQFLTTLTGEFEGSSP